MAGPSARSGGGWRVAPRAAGPVVLPACGGGPARARGLLEEDADNVVVLHDLPTGAMRQLPRFLDMLAARRVRMVQDIPDGALIVKAGRPTGSFAHVVPQP